MRLVNDGDIPLPLLTGRSVKTDAGAWGLISTAHSVPD